MIETEYARGASAEELHYLSGMQSDDSLINWSTSGQPVHPDHNAQWTSSVAGPTIAD